MLLRSRDPLCARGSERLRSALSNVKVRAHAVAWQLGLFFLSVCIVVGEGQCLTRPLYQRQSKVNREGHRGGGGWCYGYTSPLLLYFLYKVSPKNVIYYLNISCSYLVASLWKIVLFSSALWFTFVSAMHCWCRKFDPKHLVMFDDYKLYLPKAERSFLYISKYS